MGKIKYTENVVKRTAEYAECSEQNIRYRLTETLVLTDLDDELKAKTREYRDLLSYAIIQAEHGRILEDSLGLNASGYKEALKENEYLRGVIEHISHVITHLDTERSLYRTESILRKAIRRVGSNGKS